MCNVPLLQAFIDCSIQPAEVRIRFVLHAVACALLLEMHPIAGLLATQVTAPKSAVKKKKKGSMADSIAVLRSSPKIMNLALLVVSYGVSHRLFEFAWKGQLRVLYPSAQLYQVCCAVEESILEVCAVFEYAKSMRGCKAWPSNLHDVFCANIRTATCALQGMLADVSIATGWATIGLMLTGRFVFQYLGWGVAATATPIVMLLAGGVFFGGSAWRRCSQQLPCWECSIIVGAAELQ